MTQALRRQTAIRAVVRPVLRRDESGARRRPAPSSAAPEPRRSGGIGGHASARDPRAAIRAPRTIINFDNASAFQKSGAALLLRTKGNHAGGVLAAGRECGSSSDVVRAADHAGRRWPNGTVPNAAAEIAEHIMAVHRASAAAARAACDSSIAPARPARPLSTMSEPVSTLESACSWPRMNCSRTGAGRGTRELSGRRICAPNWLGNPR